MDKRLVFVCPTSFPFLVAMCPDLLGGFGPGDQNASSNPAQGVGIWSRLGSQALFGIPESRVGVTHVEENVWVPYLLPMSCPSALAPQPLDSVWFRPFWDQEISFIFHPTNHLVLSQQIPILFKRSGFACLHQILLTGWVVIISDGPLEVKLLFWGCLSSQHYRQDGWAWRQPDAWYVSCIHARLSWILSAFTISEDTAPSKILSSFS